MLAQGCLALTAFSKQISVNKFLFGLVYLGVRSKMISQEIFVILLTCLVNED